MRRVLRWLSWTVAGAGLLAALAWWLARPAVPGAFYEPPATLPARPGALLRQEAFDRGVPAGAQAWRILYTTTASDGAATVASAIVVVTRRPHDGPRPVIAWTHGTTGVVAGCAPSLLDDPFANVPALQPLLDRGWIFVGTDYAGQGTKGPHPYLIGDGEARSALDSIRALRALPGVQAGDGTVVWGHSQGGHAALWTGILAPSYAPDVSILGVAAIAPATDLRSLVRAVQHTAVGRILSSYLLHAYDDVYPDVRFDAYVSGLRRWLAGDIARRCLDGRAALVSVVESMLMGRSLFDADPTGGPFGEQLAHNTPDRPLGAPLLIAQGLADEVVLPEIQSRFVAGRCRAGQSLEYREYAGHDHLSVVAPDSPLTEDLLRWSQDRIDGVPAVAGCGNDDAAGTR